MPLMLHAVLARCCSEAGGRNVLGNCCTFFSPKMYPPYCTPWHGVRSGHCRHSATGGYSCKVRGDRQDRWSVLNPNPNLYHATHTSPLLPLVCTQPHRLLPPMHPSPLPSVSAQLVGIGAPFMANVYPWFAYAAARYHHCDLHPHPQR